MVFAKNQLLKGFSWTTVARVVQQGGQLLVTAILARFLVPEDFGFMAMISVFTGLAMLFSESGLIAAIIQKQDLSERHFSSAFWLSLGLGVVVAMIFVASVPAIAMFYDNPVLKSYCYAISPLFLIASTAVVQQSLAQRSLNYAKVAVATMIATATSGSIAIVLAYKGYGIWALIVSQLVNATAFSIFLWSTTKWRPRFIFCGESLRDILKFGLNTLGFNLVNYVSKNSDGVLIGRFLGANGLGLYSMASKLIMLPVQSVSQIVMRVMFPAFSKIQNDLELMRRLYLQLVRVVYMIMLPGMVGVFFLAPEFVSAVFGAKWMGLVDVLMAFCFIGVFQSLAATCGSIFQALGYASKQFKYALYVGLPSSIAAIVIGIPWGIEGVAWLYALRTVFYSCWLLLKAGSLLKLNLGDFSSALTYPTIAAVIPIPIVIMATEDMWFILQASGYAAVYFTCFYFKYGRSLKSWM